TFLSPILLPTLSPFFLSLAPRLPRSPLFPYTTLFRSCSPRFSSAGSRRRGSCPTWWEWRSRPPRPWWSAPRTGSHPPRPARRGRSEEHTSELQSRFDLVCRLLLEKKNTYSGSNLLYDA